jgi:hypothetical protein
MSDESKLDKILDRIAELNVSYHEMDKRLALVANSLESHFDDDVQNMERTANALEDIDVILAENTKQLTIHIQGVLEAKRQNDLLQRQVEAFKQNLDQKLSLHDAQLDELRRPHIVAKGVLWVIGALSAVGGLILILQRLNLG